MKTAEKATRIVALEVLAWAFNHYSQRPERQIAFTAHGMNTITRPEFKGWRAKYEPVLVDTLPLPVLKDALDEIACRHDFSAYTDSDVAEAYAWLHLELERIARALASQVKP